MAKIGHLAMSRRHNPRSLPLSVVVLLLFLLAGATLFAAHPVDLVRHIGLSVALAALGVLLIADRRVASRRVDAAIEHGMQQMLVSQIVQDKIGSMNTRDGPTG